MAAARRLDEQQIVDADEVEGRILAGEAALHQLPHLRDHGQRHLDVDPGLRCVNRSAAAGRFSNTPQPSCMTRTVVLSRLASSSRRGSDRGRRCSRSNTSVRSSRPRPGPGGADTMPRSITGSAVTSSRYQPVVERAHALLQDRVRAGAATGGSPRHRRPGRCSRAAPPGGRAPRPARRPCARSLIPPTQPTSKITIRAPPPADQIAEAAETGQRLAGRDRRVRAPLHLGERTGARDPDRILDPERIELVESAATIRQAAGTSQSACSSIITSIRGPTAARIRRSGSSARSRSAAEMSWPPRSPRRTDRTARSSCP